MKDYNFLFGAAIIVFGWYGLTQLIGPILGTLLWAYIIIEIIEDQNNNKNKTE